jgi:hypothetical protein
MKKWVRIFLVLAVLAGFSLACTGLSKDAKLKCPKCGAIFEVDEGLDEIQRRGW